MGNGELPTDLDTLLEAVEVMMGAEFAEALAVSVMDAQFVADRKGWQAGFWTGAKGFSATA